MIKCHIQEWCTNNIFHDDHCAGYRKSVAADNTCT